MSERILSRKVVKIKRKVKKNRLLTFLMVAGCVVIVRTITFTVDQNVIVA